MSKKNKFLLIVSLIIIVGGLFLWLGCDIVAAQDDAGSLIINNLGTTKDNSGLPSVTNPVDVVAKVIKGALGLVAIIFFIMIIIAGFRWMTAGGNEEAITSSKKNISNAIIGLVVILFSYAITYFVFNILIGSGS